MIVPTLLPSLSPFNSSRALSRRGISSLMDDFFSGMEVEPWREIETKLASFTPRVNVADEANIIRLTAELPGINQEDVQLSVRGEYLTLRGCKKEEREEIEGKNYRHSERLYGEFERVIPLQAQVDADRIEANMKNGILTVTLPKIIAESERERKISIKAK